MTKIIVFGASGQLGHCLKTICNDRNITSVYFPVEKEANILDIGALSKLFEDHKPEYIVNCAAYTAVDKAEDEPDVAEKVNKTGVENLARLCKEHDTTFVHVSTDFIFKGDVATPRTETDSTDPISVYGQTKLDGERALEEITPKYFIVRTSWLYSEYGNNFVKTMLKLGAERDELRIIADQVGTPTYAIDLAGCLMDIIENGSNAYGVYHYSNEGVTSWYDFAKAIFDISGTKVKVTPIRTAEYPTKATRPSYSVMDKSKIKNQFNITIPYWRDSLIKCISKIQSI